MAIEVGDILRGSFRQKWDGVDDVVNVYHFLIDVAGTSDDEDFLAGITQAVNLAYTEVESHLANNLQATVVDWFNVTQDTPLGQRSWGSGYSGGTGTGEALPTTAAALILLPTAKKRTQGRVYLGPFLEAAQSDSRWTGTVLTALADFATQLVLPTTVTNDGEARYVVYSRAQGDAHIPTSRRIVDIVASQRRRRLGRGS